MDRQLNINLAFTANTEAARQALQQLQQQLSTLATNPVGIGEKLTPEIQAAARAAAELQAHLSKATNVKTGALDFGKLTQSIKQSGMTLSEYGAKLQSIGPQGQQAFMSLANSVAMAEVPMRRAGTALTGMLTTLKNTAKWQLSSSLLHGFISSVSDAYNYAQDLNESLNNIRIVTGYNIDQMSKFAGEANKAAKALSTTTTAYTNASLIYYQQGLSDADVKARTDVTIKMANASRQSAEIVSDQLTAIWNNFDNGTKTLEYYADVITALGAATASSSEEISDGLEKFASVAETVGLSYEYATAALATVTATTRQSADVVGTAFKTLFARLNDLKLGETLDDGTTLGQYTENLAKIGVNIKDTSGQLKNMDQILTETAAKWDQLGRDQQVALAKGVAGIRQYSQFIALMDNWDFMEQNLQVVADSGGTLQEQADTYAESWEAADQRVRAAAEQMYSALLDDKFFINLTNKFGALIEGAGQFIKSMGGLQGVLSTFGLILTKVFSKQITEGFRNLAYNIKMSTDAGKLAVQQAKEMEMSNFAAMMAKSEASTATQIQSKQVYEQELILQKELVANAHNMTEAEQQTYQTLLEQHRVMGKQSIELQKQVELLKEQASEKSLDVIGTGMLKGTTFKEMSASMQKVSVSATGIKDVAAILQQVTVNGKASKEEVQELQQVLLQAGAGKKAIAGLAPEFAALQAGGENASQAIQKIQVIIHNINKNKIRHVINTAGIREGTAEYQRLEKELMEYTQQIGEAHIKQKQLDQSNKNLNKSFVSLKESMKKAGIQVQDWATHLTAVVSGLMSAGMLVSSINSLIDTLQDPDSSGWEKFGAVLTSVSMIAMSVGGVIKGLVGAWDLFKVVIDKNTWSTLANVIATYAQEKAAKRAAMAKDRQEKEIRENTAATNENTAAKVANKAVDSAPSGGGGNLTTGTFKSGARAGQTYYKQGGKFISADKYKALSAGGGSGGAGAASSLSILGGIAIAAAAAAAIIAVCVVGVSHLNKALNANEIAAQKAEAAATALAEAYSTTRQNYESLLTTISNSQSAQESLKNLTVGTVEFAQAVTNANEESLKLLDTYADVIDGRYQVDKNGLITIDQEALDDIKKQEFDEVQQAQSASIIGKQAARDARYQANVTKTHRETVKTQEGFTGEDWNRTGQASLTAGAIGTGAGLAVGTGMALSGATIGAAAGSAVPIVGTLIGAAAGLIIGGITGAIVNAVQKNSETEEEKQALDSLQKEFMLKGESALTDDKIKEAYGKDLTDEEIKAIRELCYEMRENTLATEAENRTMAASILSDNEKVQNARDAEDIAVFAGDAYGEASKEALEKYMGDEYQAGFFGKGSDKQKEAWERYAEAQGLSDIKGYKVTDYRKDGGVEYEYLDENGKKQKKVISQDEWAAVLAAQDADAQVNEAGNKIVDIVSKLQESTVDLLSAAKTGDMSGLTVGELGTKNKELEKLTEEELHALGFEGTKEEIIAQIAEQQQANIDNIKLAANQYGETVGGLISTMLDTNDATIKNVTQGTLKAYADTLSDLALHGGEDVMKEFDSGLQGIMDTYSNKSEEIMSIANNIDWSQGESALQDFNYQLMKMGINIDEGSAEWQKLVSAMQNMNTSVVHRDLDAIRAEITDIKKLCSEIEIGSVISDEDYDKLIKYKAELADLFIMTADGYKYVGGGNLEKEAGEAAYKQLEDTKKKNKQARDADAYLDRIGWRDGSGNFTDEDWYGLANGTDSNTAYKKMTDYLATNASEHIKNLGFDASYLQDLANTLNDANATDDQKKAAKELLQQFYQEIIALNDNKDADLYNDTLAEEIYASTATTISQLVEMSNKLKTETGSAMDPEVFAKQLSVLTWEGANAAQSLSELQSVWAEALATGAEVNYEAYSQNLLRLAESYTICKDEAQAFQTALQGGNDEAIKAAEENLEATIMLGEAASEYGLEEKELSLQAKVLAKQYGLTSKAAAALAVQNQRMNKGVSTLVNNWKDWRKTLTSTNKDSQDWIKSAVECTAAIADMVGASEDLELPAEFFDSADNLALLDAAAQGSEQAIAKLGMAVASAQIKMFEFQEGMKNTAGSLINEEQFNTWQTTLLNGITNVKNALDGLDIGDNVYEKLGGDDWVNALNEMAIATGMSVEEMNSLLNSMGVKAKVKVTSVKQEMMVPTYTEIVEPGAGVDTDGDGKDDKFGYKRYTVPGEPQKVQGYVQVAQISTEENDLGEPEIEYIGNGNVSTSAGNGGKPPEPAENKKVTTKKTDVVERYKEWDDALDDVAYAMERVNKQADRLYGANRINALKKQNELLLKQKDLLTKKKADAETDLKSDKDSLINTARAHGVNFEFDAQGNISNYTAEMTKLYDELAAAQATWADASKHASKDAQDEYEKNVVQPIQDKIDAIKEALGIYTDTRELIEDLQQQIDDAFYEWQDNNYEQIHYKLELELEINDTELRMIDYYLNKIADDFYSMGEAAAKISTEKVDTLVNTLQDYESFENDLHAKFKAGDISQEKYVEGLKETFNGYLDNLEALQDLDKEMQHYYEDTLSAGAEELAVYTDHMEHLTSVLDHYQNIVTMMNGEMDFDNIGTILEGKATTLNNEMKVAESNYAMLKAEQAAMQAAYDAADAEGKKYLKSSLDAINAQVDEAHEAMLSKTEEWAEAQRAIMENSMKKAAHEMEMAFTNNMGFDAVNSSLDRLSSYSDEYLTKTNQIYETQKLMNTAQQAIDKTTNQAAKVRLENYNKEIKQLQEKNKLSNLELEIAKANYDVLLAEIALEEAQRAKSTVRLQKDSEGNYGYVYTADKENITKAEQDLADAQNALYNIGLEGANDYGQKLLDLQQQLANDLVALEEARAAGQYATDEEYYAAKERLISEYNNLFEAYSEQYTTALGVDTAIQQEAWVNAYDEMILKTEDWQIRVDGYTKLCEGSYSHWREVVQAESDIVNKLLNEDVVGAVKNVTDESNKLKDKVVKEVIPAIQNEYKEVRTAVLAYESLRSGLQLTIEKYEGMARAIQEVLRQQALLEGQTNTPEVETPTTNPDPNPDPKDPPENQRASHSEMSQLVYDIMVAGKYGNMPGRRSDIIAAGYSEADAIAAQAIVNDIAANATTAWHTGVGWSAALDKHVTAHGYASGGYTGEWGPEGKLAWLHEKELILNARDTENFLAATGILRDISKAIDLSSIQNQSAWLQAIGTTKSEHQTLEQMVSIEAHFPNVTDRNEIEEAFNNLINTASQYANRKF